MRIAINAADLDHSRIDGTRIYIQKILDNLGLLDKEDQFLIYHKGEFNPELRFTAFDNYKMTKLPFPFWWTQTRFALEIFSEKPEVLWMPMHTLPRLRSKKTKTVVTIHDLAFKFFPQYFTKNDLWRLNNFTNYAVKYADKLIAVSNSTKNDILKVYPNVREDKIRVIYHGYDENLFNVSRDELSIKNTLKKFGIDGKKYIITVGAIQPRKNLGVLTDAFTELKKDEKFKSYKLVIAGSPAWQSSQIIGKMISSEDVIVTGNFATRDLPSLLKGAEIFVLPSLYEGFGLPLLEAMASGVPTIAADNSSLKEIVNDEDALFKGNNVQELAKKLHETLKNDKIMSALTENGLKRAQDFSWKKSAQETLLCLKT
jgi:glycosyltransferase involved in cell wall biosynthesis